jgi:hypothetical protein
MPIQEIDWNKLEPYSGDNKKSFEELCYQIVSEKFKNEISNDTILTSIDDSGGGDGVEFYLTFTNGDVFGWQAKFFCRLNEGGRKEQIKKSLQTSYKKHPKLKKWFFCSKCDFTPNEKAWFDDELANSTKDSERVLPEKHNIELIHWGESVLLGFLKDYPAISKFFFSKKLLAREWFQERYDADIQKTQIKTKYEAQIHIPTNVDTAINKVLGGSRLAEILEKEMESQQVKRYAEEYKDAFAKLFSEDVKNEYKDIQSEFRKFLIDKNEIIDNGISKLHGIRSLVLNKNGGVLKNKRNELEEYINDLWDFCKEYDKLTKSGLCKPIEHLRTDQEELSTQNKEVGKQWFDIFKKLYKKIVQKKEKQIYQSTSHKKESDEIKKENNKRSSARDILFEPLYALKEYAIPSLDWCLKVFELIEQNELHISGGAGMGKTHISFNIYEDQIKIQKQPAIFVFAKDISTEQVLENQLKVNFDVPADWSFNDFLGALNVTAKVNKTKIPIIIDGLNESTYWNSVWKMV